VKKIILSFILLFSIFAALSFTKNIVEASEPTTGQDVTFTYTINKNGTETTSAEQVVDYGTTVSIDSGSHSESGYSFVGFIENGKVDPTLNTSETFRVTENTNLTLFYKDINETAVILMDANQDYIGVWYTDGSDLLVTTTNALPNLSNYSKPGLTVDGWTTDGTTVISDLSTHAFTSDVLVYIKYSGPSTSDLTLTVTNGSGDGTYAFNETVTVDTTGATGTTFDYWLKDGEIASYDETFSFTMATNHTLEAVYDTSATPPTDNFVAVSEPYDITTDYQTIVGQFDLADGEELVEYGFVHSNETAVPTLATNHSLINYSNKYNATTNEFVMSFSTTSYVLGQYYRAFITTIDTSNNLTTTYSEVMTNTVDTVDVWFYNADGWSGVRAHVWDNGTAGTTWPGVAMTQEFEGDGTTPTGWWYTSIPIADTDSGTSGLQYSFNVVFNDSNNADNKTQDIALDDTTGLYVTASGGVSAIKEIASVTTRVYFYNAWDPALSDVKIHIWGGSLDDNSYDPASLMNISSTANWYYYDIETNKTTFNFLIYGTQSGGTKQTVDYTYSEIGTTLYIEFGAYNEGLGKFEINVLSPDPIPSD
jgi:hypothetical protein